jgi:hypothetical protein
MNQKIFRRTAAVVLAAAAVFAFGACSVSISGKNTAKTVSAAGDSSSSKAGGKTAVSADNVVYGQVTAVNGNEITLALGTMDQRGGMMGGGMQGTMPQMPGGDGTASGSTQGTVPQMPGGDGTNGGSLLTESGQTLTITITDTSILSKQSFGKDASASSGSSVSLSDITVGTYLAVTLESDGATPSSVVIFSALQTRDRGTGGGKFSGGANGDTVSSSAASYKTV